MIHLREDRGARVDVWHVEPPMMGLEFHVIRSEWREDVDPPERHIFEWSALPERRPHQ